MNDEIMSREDQLNPKGPRRRLFARRSSRTAAVDREGWLLLASSGWYVRLIDVLDQPTTAVLAGEDSCWQFAMADWRRRRPSRWNRAERKDWRTEGELLESKRLRLVEMTRQVRTLRPKSAPASKSDPATTG